MNEVTSMNAATVFVDDLVIPCEIPTCLLTDNEPQFVSKFFAAITVLLGVKQLTATAYIPQTNGQGERLNKKILMRLQHYVAEYKIDWD